MIEQVNEKNKIEKKKKVYIWEEPSSSDSENTKEWIKKSTIVDSTKSVDDIKFAPSQFEKNEI